MTPLYRERASLGKRTARPIGTTEIRHGILRFIPWAASSVLNPLVAGDEITHRVPELAHGLLVAGEHVERASDAADLLALDPQSQTELWLLTQASREAFMGRRRAQCFVLFLALASVGMAAAAAPPIPEGGIKVAVLPTASSHWVLVYNLASLGSFSPSSVTIFDGDSQKLLGMLTGGLGSSFAIAPDRSAFYMMDTFYSRGSRGQRTDVLTIYDPKTLLPNGEVVLPSKRQLTAQDNATSAVTPDGKLLLVANMTPATSATVVDVARRKVLGEIELTGCVEIIMSADRQFVSLCGDGSMMTTNFDDRGNATSQKRTGAPFFNPDKDPVYALPAVVGKTAYFLSYGGKIFPVDLSTDPATPGEPWSLLSADDEKNGWKPGGVQALAAHQKSGRIYALMHRGGEWSHKMPGMDVWVHDAKTRQRVQTIKLEQTADAIMTTQDDAPLLVAVMTTIPPATLGYVQFYSASDGKLRGTVKDFPALAEHIYALP